MKKKLVNLCLLLGVCGIVAGCANSRAPKTPRTQAAFRSLSYHDSGEPAVSAMRTTALRDTALSVGARGGLAERAAQLNQVLIAYEAMLTRVFNFRGMVLDDNVLPPVLTEARNSLNLANDAHIRIQDRNYEILSQARFITAPPHWRDYLWMNYQAPDAPDRSLLPRNPPEAKIWQRYIDQGWEAGRVQAGMIFQENLNRLTRDYRGMALYRKLHTLNMVSAPYVATLNLGITGNGSNMAVNDRVLKITAFPALKAAGKEWKTEISQHD